MNPARDYYNTNGLQYFMRPQNFMITTVLYCKLNKYKYCHLNWAHSGIIHTHKHTHTPLVPLLASSRVIDGLAGTSSRSLVKGAGLVRASCAGKKTV